MKTLLSGLALALTLSSCASEGPPRLYDNNDLELVVGNAARMTCSCLWVMDMPETYCRAWVKASPDLGRIDIDLGKKEVLGTALISWSARARFIDDQVGCVLE